MASVCDVCGKKPQFGMRLSHSHRRTKRRWNPNVQRVRAIVNGTPKRIHVCTSCLRQARSKAVGEGAPVQGVDPITTRRTAKACRVATPTARVRPRRRRARRLDLPHAAPGSAGRLRPRRRRPGDQGAHRRRDRHGPPHRCSSDLAPALRRGDRVVRPWPVVDVSAAVSRGWERPVRHPKDERARRPPDVAVLEGPCIGQGPVADTLDQPGRSQLMSRPLVELLQPRSDDPEIQESSEAELAVEVWTRRCHGGGTRRAGPGTAARRSRPCRASGHRRTVRAGAAIPSEIRGAATSVCT